MPRETLTSRERWLAVLRRQTPDRVPMDYWATPETTRNLLAHLGCDFPTLLERLHLDQPLRLEARYVGPPLPDNTDAFGLRYEWVDHGTGAYKEAVNASLARFASVAEIEAGYSWPSPDWWDYAHLPALVQGQEHRPLRGGGSEPFLLYRKLRGETQAYVDLVEHPDIVQHCLGRLFDLAYTHTLRLFETLPGQVMISFIAEDLGGQQGLLMSPAMIRQFLLPGMRRMVELTRQHGSFAFCHSDGAIRAIVPDLIGIGIQALNPIQWRLPGMDRAGLKRDFGEQLIFHGGVDNQQTLPFGSTADVAREVEENYRTLGAGGGYILAPCHYLQDVTPPENIVALYETGYALGWRG
ncbi:MAG: uroporphyrinogen-III decarboxylase-like protein [Verrucomicrobiales bacterium]|nr:uroporphyrinogen-III decarboxylase-like protein [Verrucomicrobiales bacterium]